MGTKRKRPGKQSGQDCISTKTLKPKINSAVSDQQQYSCANHPVLKHYFRHVLTLREYIVSQLLLTGNPRAEYISQYGKSPEPEKNHRIETIKALLDTSVVGFNDVNNRSSLHERRAQDLALFTQQLPSSTLGNHTDPGDSLQTEAVYFVVWLLFRRHQPPAKPQHLLCQGFERLSGATAQSGIKENAIAGIPGVVYQHANKHVQALTSSPWCSLLSLLGRGGDLIMVDLLLESCLFVPAVDGAITLSQLSGYPLTTIPTIPVETTIKLSTEGNDAPKMNSRHHDPNVRKPSEIRIVRNRMYYSKPAFTSRGCVKLGMHPIHVLNRCQNLDDVQETVHIMKYIFPRQFKLHNVFTFVRDHKETALPFKDYNLRETEIRQKDGGLQTKAAVKSKAESAPKPVLPKRLRSVAFDLVQSLRKLHHKCAYVELLKHHCPISTDLQPIDVSQQKLSSTHMATPVSCVSAFCQAVIKKVIPRGFWGTGEKLEYNQRVILHMVDHFLRARRFETLSLDEIMSTLKISGMPWLTPARTADQKMSISDFEKRKEVLAEFVYYLFDSFLMPLVRSNFHVTESGAHRNRLFYFRQDVWQKISEPAMAELKDNLFEQLKTEEVRARLASRTFGFSHVRLLPKAVGFRPIVNLRRRPYVWQNGKRILGRSINSAIGPAFRVLNYEKSTHQVELGCSLFSVGDIYPKLKEFTSRQTSAGRGGQPLYLAKVDVQACFDTVPQEHLLQVITALLSSEEYHVENHAKVKPPQVVGQRQEFLNTKAVLKFDALARPAHKPGHEGLESHECNERGNVVAVGPLGYQSHNKHGIADLLREHVEYNIVKIGRKYYRQKNGIPQGSVLSSLLCNFFYGSLEKDILQFTQRADSILIRLIDDFLLVSLDQGVAVRFLQLMHQGIPDYGISVKAEKSLVSFNCHVNGQQIPQCQNKEFPYCGLLIDSRTLDIKKNAATKINTDVADSLTVEYGSIPGRTFRRKALNALKLQLHGMFFDTSFNSLDTVLTNLYIAFKDAARRCFYYMKSLSASSQPSFERVKSKKMPYLIMEGIATKHG
ncbi:telomerase reverse transcriptase [Venturia nashicola]|uniref:Telomerase reverse transcriptase n=1 Tax=Venturia nashicola TaxID=86259 RepID=A0A4Z1PCT2_9PEZI|nr:telomerase reverse transcriptase [Venturia nashicola]